MKNKLYKCEKCGNNTVIRSRIKEGKFKGKKVCSNCYSFLKPLRQSKPKVVGRVKKAKKVDSDSGNQCINVYFEYHIGRCFKSDESNDAISATIVNICHIFNKSKHKSIACNLENAVYLTWQQHHDFDKLLDSHDWEELEKRFPNSWYDTCVKAANLLPQVIEKTKFKTLYEEYLQKHGFI